MDNTNTLIGKKVAVVGGLGFLGTHLVDYLSSIGSKVVIYDNRRLGQECRYSQNVTTQEIDITLNTVEAISSQFLQEGIEYVFNYAAIPFIPECKENPLLAFQVNTLGNLRVCQAAHLAGVNAILQVSSAEVYGDDYSIGKISEKDSIGASPSTYAASKVAIDQACINLWIESKVPVILLRQFNCIGSGETHPYVIPEIISQVVNCARREEKLAKIKIGENTQRDFMYAVDAVRYASELILRGKFGQAYNLGSEKATYIYDIAELVVNRVKRKMDYKFKWIHLDKEQSRIRPKDIQHLCSDNTKIHNRVRYRQEESLLLALDEAIEDYLTNGWIYENQEA